MTKRLSIAIMIGLAFWLSGCITSTTPSTDTLTLAIGERQVFTVNVAFSGEQVNWFLNGAPVATSTRTYTYEAAGAVGSRHVLTAESNYLGSKDKHSWIIDLEDAGISKIIGPAGGTLELTDSQNPNIKTTLEIPAGALTQDTRITAKTVKKPGGFYFQPVGSCVDFEMEGNHQFLIPVNIVFSYDDANNDGLINGQGVDENSLTVQYYNAASSAWEPVAISGRDTINNRVQVSTTHFSTYVLNVPTWQNLYGGSGSEEIHSCAPTMDGGYIVAGASDSTDIPGQVNGGGMDFYLVKLDSSGLIEWQRQIGLEQGDELFSIQQTLDGGYIVSGNREVYSDKGGFYVARLDSLGFIVWEKWYTNNNNDCANMVKPTPDGGFIIAGTAYSQISGTTFHGGDGDYYIVKVDAEGDIQWHALYGGSSTEELTSIQAVSDGGYIVTGYSDSDDIPGVSSERDFHVFKLDSSGKVVWNKKFGGNGYDEAWFVVETSDKGFVILGEAQSTDIGDYKGEVDILLIKIDAGGNEIWQEMYGGSGCEGASSVAQTADGGFIIAGISNSTDIPGTTPHGDFDTYIIKTGPTGILEWQKLYGGSGREESDNCTDSVHQTSDGGYIIVSDTLSTDIPGTINKGNRDFYVLKLNKDGEL